MKTFKELTEERYSVRDYKDIAIETEKLNYILECARMAPSAVNFQPWKIYVITPESSVKNDILSCYAREWIKTAPYCLVCCIQHNQSWKRSSDNKDHGDIDIAILTEHICLAATEQGLGTCWVCNFDTERCKSVLNLNNDEEPAVLIPIGYPSDKSIKKEKNRKAINEIVEFV